MAQQEALPAQLLRTKLTVPPYRSGLISRPRLISFLKAGLDRGVRLILISAPAGYGKTTLIIEWIHSLGIHSRVAWLSLDEGDNDPVRFLRYWISSLQEIDASVGQRAKGLLGLPHLPPFQTIMDELISDLTGMESQIVMVLDDYHIITNLYIHEALEYFLNYQPTQIHLTINTRADPSLPLARLRARGQMTEVRAHDLRFTLDEAQKFFSQSMHLDLALETVTTLEARTEGWAAGLQLAALALQNLPNSQAFLQTFRGTNRYILDYLAEEVLRQQDEEIRNFLFQTAILEKFNASLCNAITGRSDSHGFLARLEQTNLFIIPLDNERVWYRYHHLFADYLWTGLEEPAQRLLQEKASLWYEANDLIFESVKYAFLSGNMPLAADVIERGIQKISAWSSGEIATLVGWLDALPVKLLRARPALCLQASRVWYLNGRIAHAEKFLDQADQSLQELPQSEPSTRSLLAVSAGFRSSIAAQRGEVRAAIEQATNAHNQLPEEEFYDRARAIETMAIAYELSGDLAKASQHYMHASDIAHAIGVSFMTVISRCEAALVQITQGNLQLAAQICQQALELVEEKKIPPLGFVKFVLAEIAWERNQLASAEQYLTEAIELCRQGGLVEEYRFELLSLARLKQSGGNFEAAMIAIEQADAIAKMIGIPRLITLSSAHRIRIQLAKGMLGTVNRWAQEYQDLRSAHPVEYTREYEDLTLARVYLANDQYEQALEVLTPLYEQAYGAGRIRTCIEATLLLSLIANAQNKMAASQDWMVKAVTLAEPDGFVRLFLEAGSGIVDNLSSMRAAAPRFVDQLLQEFPSQHQITNQNELQPAYPKLSNPLTEQELCVLNLIVMGKSNQEIAEELFITVGTAKWHVHNILQKLEVSNRPQAIALARELGL